MQNEKFSLGVKQIEKNPWDELAQKYAPGSVVTGKITNFTDFGIFMEIEEGIEGLVHISEISQSASRHLRNFIRRRYGFRCREEYRSEIEKNQIEHQRAGSTAPTPSSNQYINNTENVGSNLSQLLLT